VAHTATVKAEVWLIKHTSTVRNRTLLKWALHMFTSTSESCLVTRQRDRATLSMSSTVGSCWVSSAAQFAQASKHMSADICWYINTPPLGHTTIDTGTPVTTFGDRLTSLKFLAKSAI